MVRFSAPQPRHKQAQKRINTHGRVPASRPQRATSVVFHFLLQPLSLSLSLALRLSVSLRKEGHKTLLRRAAASGVLRPLGDSHRIFRPLKDGFALFFVLLSEGRPKDPSPPYEGPRTLRFSIPSRSSKGPCALRKSASGSSVLRPL